MRKLEEHSRAFQDLGRMKQQVEANTNAIADMRREGVTLRQDLEEARNRVGRLEQDFSRLRGDVGQAPLGGERRQSLALPLAPDSAAVPAPPTRPAGFGTVRLINSYIMPVNVVVDGRVYPLGSNQAINLDRPAGYFNYEVMGIQGNAVRTLNAGEMLTIQIVPR